MSRVYDGTREGKVLMFQDALARAHALQDGGMVRNCRAELAALGVFETTEAVDELERAVPPRRGRRPKPRCEHGRIMERCLDCTEGEA